MGIKISKIKERILYYANYKGITYDRFSESLNMSYGSFKGIAKERPINSDALEILISRYPDVNPEWLLTGRGEMIRKSADQNSININQNKNKVAYNSIYGNELITNKEKDLIEDIKTQLTEQKQILEARLADKDKQIEDLKNNLGMVVASKDAMLAMKEEAIKGKNEIIRIQSRRIAELESHRELEEAKKIYFEQTMSGNVMSSKRGALPDVVRIEEKKIPRTERADF